MYAEKTENLIWIYIIHNIHSSIIYKSQDMEQLKG